MTRSLALFLIIPHSPLHFSAPFAFLAIPLKSLLFITYSLTFILPLSPLLSCFILIILLSTPFAHLFYSYSLCSSVIYASILSFFLPFPHLISFSSSAFAYLQYFHLSFILFLLSTVLPISTIYFLLFVSSILSLTPFHLNPSKFCLSHYLNAPDSHSFPLSFFLLLTRLLTNNCIQYSIYPLSSCYLPHLYLRIFPFLSS